MIKRQITFLVILSVLALFVLGVAMAIPDIFVGENSIFTPRDNEEAAPAIIHTPLAGEHVASPLVVIGEVSVEWFSEEDTFLVQLIDEREQLLTEGSAELWGELQNSGRAAFRASVRFDQPESESGALILHGEHGEALRIPLRF